MTKYLHRRAAAEREVRGPAGVSRSDRREAVVTPDIVNLISIVESRLAALDINTRQTGQEAARQLKEIGVQAREAAAEFRQCDTQAAETSRTLGWHATMAKRIFAQISKNTRR